MLLRLRWMAWAFVWVGCVGLDERSFDDEQGAFPAFPLGGAAGNGADAAPAQAPGAAELRAEPQAIEFGPVTLGVEAKASLKLVNEGIALVSPPVASIAGPAASDFVLLQNLCVGALDTGQSCDIAIAVRAGASGARAATLSIDGGPGGVIAVPLSATALRQASIRIEPLPGGSADYGALKLDASREQQLRLTNDGSEPSGVLSLSIAGEDFTLLGPAGASGCVSGTTTLEAAQSCDVNVAFRPLDRGDRFGTLTVRAGEDAGASLALSGTGLAPALLSASPLALDYGAVVRGGSAERFLQIANLGDEASGPLVFSKDGASSESLSWDVAGCPEELEALGSCELRLEFSPAAAGPHAARLTLSAEPGGSASIAVAGTGILPGALSITEEAGSSASFGGILQNESSEQTFVISNTGNLPSGPITLSVEGAGFSSAPGGSCQSGVTELAGGASCTVRVRLTSGALRGALSGTLAVVSAGAGGNSLGLSGQALAPATLVALGGTQRDFGAGELGQDSGTFDWVLENGGDVATASPLVTSPAADFRITSNSCGSAIAPRASCTIRVVFAPSALGNRAGSIGVRAGALATSLAMTGSGQVRLSVQLAGVGSGQITSQPAGLNCTASAGCSALFSTANVTLSARPNNGSDSLFGGWSEASCPPPQRTCALTLSRSRSLTATFNRVANNIAFVSSQGIAADLGSLAPYDAHCNALATAAGINNAAGNAYLAAMSTTTVALPSRFGGNVQGWVRMDGRPFISSMADVFQRRVMHHPVVFDEGGAATDAFYMTGSRFDGTSGRAAETCENWTSNVEATIDISMYPMVGSAQGGPDSWLDTAVGRCHVPNPILCMGRTKTVALTVPRATGRRIWVSRNAFTMGSGAPDAHCQADRPTGVASAAALVSLTNRAAASVLDPAANYVRLDGILVGTGAQLIAKQPLTGIWVTSTGQSEPSYLSRIWSGADSMSSVGTAGSTCNNWTSTAENVSGNLGFYYAAGDRFWGAGGIPCSHAADPAQDLAPHFYCVER